MSTYVLIHGAWHGGWCWEKVVPLLEAHGHRVVAPDLLGHGEDETPISEISLRVCVDRVCEVLDGESEPVILVGHSLGGLIISQVAEERPDRVRGLVYLAAFLLKNGRSRAELGPFEGSVLGPSTLVPSADKAWVEVKREAVKPAFYSDCSDVDASLAAARLGREAMALLTTPLRLTHENFGQIPRSYIECLQDQAIPPSAQRSMYTAVPCERVIVMDAGHSPFFSRPDELAGHLLSLG